MDNEELKRIKRIYILQLFSLVGGEDLRPGQDNVLPSRINNCPLMLPFQV